MFFTVAELRDKGTAPQVVINAMLASDLPDDVKQNAQKIVVLVYSSPELTPDEIGFAVFGQCVEQQTGVRRQT